MADDSDYFPPMIDPAGGGEWYISRRLKVFEKWEYLRHDMTWHESMHPDHGGTYFMDKRHAETFLRVLVKGNPQTRQPITITDEGDGQFIATCGDKYTSPDHRWNIIGIVMEWFLDGEHVEHFETSDAHAESEATFSRLMKSNTEEHGDGTC